MSKIRKPSKIAFQFSKVFNCTALNDEVQEEKPEQCDLLQEWYAFWLNRGDQIVLDSWAVKYGDYIEPTGREEYKDCTEQLEVIEPSINEEVETWQSLWDQHTQEQYQSIYELFAENYKLANESYQFRTGADSEKENTKEAIIDQELNQLKALGLPTSFGGRRKRRQQQVPEKTYLSWWEEVSDFDSETEGLVKPEEEGDETTLDVDIEQMSLKQQSPPIHGVNDASKAVTRKNKKRATGPIPEYILKDKSMLKYWFSRFQLFSRFDKGIQLDKESWFSVTPETVAKQIAKRMACDVIVDAFCGSGGNSIQFAMTCAKVIAIDIDPVKVANAKINARIYGVEDKIDFIVGDFLQVCERLKADVVFLSPPWGGPEYIRHESYDIEANLVPVPASELIEKARRISMDVAVYLPRNSDMQQIVRLAGVGNRVEVEKSFLNKKLLALTAYYGSLVAKAQV